MGGKGSGRKPREYPAAIVEMACGMYLSGMTVAEIRCEFPRGYRVQTILQRYLDARRPLGKRDQRGEANPMWKGDGAGYSAIHLRLGRAGDHTCADCGSQADHWSYRGGDVQEKRDPKGCPYSTDPAFYDPRCALCHHRYDYKGRRRNGEWATREEVMPNV